MIQLPILEDLGDLTGKRVLVRTDFNVPLAQGKIRDDLRIKEALPTLSYLVNHGAKVTVCSHLGRPNGMPNQDFSLEPVKKRLQELLPEVSLRENLRFESGEENGDPEELFELS